MNVKAAGLIIAPFIIQIVIALFGSHFSIGVTGGVALQTGVSISVWDAITSTFTWFASALTFQLTGAGLVIAVILWVLVVMEFLGILIIIRGAN